MKQLKRISVCACRCLEYVAFLPFFIGDIMLSPLGYDLRWEYIKWWRDLKYQSTLEDYLDYILSGLGLLLLSIFATVLGLVVEALVFALVVLVSMFFARFPLILLIVIGLMAVPAAIVAVRKAVEKIKEGCCAEKEHMV